MENLNNIKWYDFYVQNTIDEFISVFRLKYLFHYTSVFAFDIFIHTTQYKCLTLETKNYVDVNFTLVYLNTQPI